MHLTSPIALSNVAPASLTNPQVAAAGVSASAMRADAVFGIPQAATPTTLVFGQTPVVGAGAKFADDLHQHGLPSTWTKVAAGQATSVASLDLAALSGYKRYRLTLHARVAAPGTTNWQSTLKLNNSAAHDAVGMKVTGGAVSAISSLSAATAVLINNGANAVSTEVWDLLVTHDDQAASRVGFSATVSRQQPAATTGALTVMGGALQGTDASITEILTSFGVSQDGISYVLYGSNETA